jgi:hypothetical protein
MDNNQSLEKRIRRKVLAKRIAIFVGIPAVAVAITSTLYYVEKNRKEENMKSIKPPAIIQLTNPDYSPQMSDLYTPDVISQTDVGYVK